MNLKSLKDELQNILLGKRAVSHGATLQAITRYLRGSVGAGAETQRNESIKSQETRKLIEFINAQQLWNCDIHNGFRIWDCGLRNPLIINTFRNPQSQIRNPMSIFRLACSLQQGRNNAF